MKIRSLQQQLDQNSYLLPSQRDLLSRLLFQLAFNDFDRLAIVGAAGSGKSTLALVLAELFSECQEMPVNVALVQSPLSLQQLSKQLSQQWFATEQLDAESLLARCSTDNATEYVLLLDDADTLDLSCWALLEQLPARLFCFISQPDPRFQLNLTIPALSLVDSQQLLQEQQLDPLALAERFALSQGNLHLLLQMPLSATRDGASNTSVTRTKKVAAQSGSFPWLAAVALIAVVAIAAVSWLGHTPSTTLPPLPTSTAADTAVTANIPRAELMPDLPEQSLSTAEMIEPETPAFASVTVSETTDHVNLVAEHSSDAIPEQVAEPVTAVATEIPVAAPEQAPVTIKPTPEAQPQTVRATATVKPAGSAATALAALAATERLVQLAVLSDEAALKRFQQQYPGLQYQLYQRQQQGRQQWVLVAGPFKNNAAASAYIAQLPAKLRDAGPFIRTARSVQQDLAAATQDNR
ncbi:SPOR domain-containing protein [Alishewanella sp. HH-ZS]|uniref:SPOR domain-containing protein n=1 Tax=Alishewanella sp. HH-ZS TaxID=1856684 RepID=UPI0008236F06|nr:SPOR domain-containing protein [Alishewanella sp. HH-ZS]OCW96865.1 sporulation protein [Alishewanella sp. HH-ZS]